MLGTSNFQSSSWIFTTYFFPGIDVAINIEDWQDIEVQILQKSAYLWVSFVILKNLKRKKKHRALSREFSGNHCEE